jgi:hypothetical protein
MSGDVPPSRLTVLLDLCLPGATRVAGGVCLAFARPQAAGNRNVATFVNPAAAALIAQNKQQISPQAFAPSSNTRFHWDRSQTNPADRDGFGKDLKIIAHVEESRSRRRPCGGTTSGDECERLRRQIRPRWLHIQLLGSAMQICIAENP